MFSGSGTATLIDFKDEDDMVLSWFLKGDTKKTMPNRTWAYIVLGELL